MLKQAFGVVYALLLLRASVLAFHPEDFTSGAALQCVVCNSSFYCKSGVRYNCPPNSGLPALLEEIEKNGTAEEKNCAEYVATEDAGGDQPDIRFQNGWKRDCDPFTGKVLESRGFRNPATPAKCVFITAGPSTKLFAKGPTCFRNFSKKSWQRFIVCVCFILVCVFRLLSTKLQCAGPIYQIFTAQVWRGKFLSGFFTLYCPGVIKHRAPSLAPVRLPCARALDNQGFPSVWQAAEKTAPRLRCARGRECMRGLEEPLRWRSGWQRERR
jgi:hypothetical protein